MVDPKQLTSRDVGRWVCYVGGAGEIELGRIKGWKTKENLVYVVYNCGGMWHEFYKYTGVPTTPADLHFKHPQGVPMPTGNNAPAAPPAPPVAAIVDAEQFLAYAAEYRQRIESGAASIPAEVKPKIELIARTIPPNQSAEFWAGFYTGLLAMTGAMETTFASGALKHGNDVKVFGEFIALAAVLAWNEQCDRENSLFDQLSAGDIE